MNPLMYLSLRFKGKKADSSRILFTQRLFLILVLSMSTALTGCGFQLAGTAPEMLALEGQKVYLLDKVSRQELVDTPVINQLRTEMLTANMDVFLEPRKEMTGILIIKESTSERSLSLTQNLFNRHIEIEKTIEYQIHGANDETVTQILTTSARRDLFEDQSNPFAKAQERQKLINLINEDISKNIISQFANALMISAE